MSRSIPRKKSSASISPRTSAAALCVLVLLGAGGVVADTHDPYYRLIYDYEVASFCGLVRTPVHAAYKTKRAALEDSSELPGSTLSKIRIGAMADAEREYINRGLGGHKPWCRSDGMAGVGRILGE